MKKKTIIGLLIGMIFYTSASWIMRDLSSLKRIGITIIIITGAVIQTTISQSD